MDRSKVTERDVKAANRQLYDAVADQYEAIDGRRSPKLAAWLRGNLVELRPRAPGGCLLDIGAGSGLVTRCAEGLFAPRVGVDLSPRILAAHRASFDLGVAADVDRLPFADGSFDVVTCFAVLHHLYAFDGLVAEVARVLRPGGVFYSDHDLEATFWRRFRLLLGLYRRLRNARFRYQKADARLSREVYDLSEWQSKGVDAAALVSLFEASGFSIEARYHWFGLSSLTDRLFGSRPRGRGWAPLVAITATGGGA